MPRSSAPLGFVALEQSLHPHISLADLWVGVCTEIDQHHSAVRTFPVEGLSRLRLQYLYSLLLRRRDCKLIREWKLVIHVSTQTPYNPLPTSIHSYMALQCSIHLWRRGRFSQLYQPSLGCRLPSLLARSSILRDTRINDLNECYCLGRSEVLILNLVVLHSRNESMKEFI